MNDLPAAAPTPESEPVTMPPERRRWMVGAAVALAVAAGGSGAWWRSLADHAGTGELLGADFWRQSFIQPDGNTLAFATLAHKPLLLNFWATWCPPCVEELPMLERFSREQAVNGLQVVGLAIDQPSAVRKFLERVSISFPVGLAGMQGTELVRQLGNTTGGLPFTIVLNRDGAVLGRKMGKLEPADLEAWQRGLVHG